MDIKPFNEGMPDFWASMQPVSYILFGLSVVAALTIIVAIAYKEPEFFLISFGSAQVLFVLGMMSVSLPMNDKYLDNYNNAISELKTSLSNDGFELVSGKPNLLPNTQSSVVLSYEGKTFDCTMYSPEDATMNVSFSCDGTKLSLSQIKEQR